MHEFILIYELMLCMNLCLMLLVPNRAGGPIVSQTEERWLKSGRNPTENRPKRVEKVTEKQPKRVGDVTKTSQIAVWGSSRQCHTHKAEAKTQLKTTQKQWKTTQTQWEMTSKQSRNSAKHSVKTHCMPSLARSVSGGWLWFIRTGITSHLFQNLSWKRKIHETISRTDLKQTSIWPQMDLKTYLYAPQSRCAPGPANNLISEILSIAQLHMSRSARRKCLD